VPDLLSCGNFSSVLLVVNSILLQLAATEEIDNSARVKALEVLSCLVTLKKKAIQKLNMVQPILDVVFSLMCKCDEEEEDLEDSEETEKAASYAARVW